jgi:hypothetical protein
MRICTRCGREIMSRRRTAGGQVLSEFVSESGECYACAYTQQQQSPYNQVIRLALPRRLFANDLASLAVATDSGESRVT